MQTCTKCISISVTEFIITFGGVWRWFAASRDIVGSGVGDRRSFSSRLAKSAMSTLAKALSFLSPLVPSAD